jgi:hypothetical protein
MRFIFVATPERVEFWLREARTLSIIQEVAQRFPGQLARAVAVRPLLELALRGDDVGLVGALENEEKQEREADRLYWLPLRAELQELRHRKRKE